MTYVPEISNIEYTTPETKEQWEAWMRRRIEERDTLLEAAKAAQEANIEKRMAKKSDVEPTGWAPGDLVLRRHPTGRKTKLSPNLLGPYQVVSQKGAQVNIRDLTTHVVSQAHVSQLKRFYESDEINPVAVSTIDANSFIVEDIVAHKTLRNRPLCQSNKTDATFTVKWIGYEETTEEPWKNVMRTRALHEYLTKLSLQALIPKTYTR